MELLSIKSMISLMRYSRGHAYRLKNEGVFVYAQLRKGGSIVISDEGLLDFVLDFLHPSTCARTPKAVTDWIPVEVDGSLDVSTHPLLNCKWLCVAKAAKELNIAPSTLYSLVDSGSIGFHRPEYTDQYGITSRGAIRISMLHCEAYKVWLLQQSSQDALKLTHLNLNFTSTPPQLRRKINLPETQIPVNRLKNNNLH